MTNNCTDCTHCDLRYSQHPRCTHPSVKYDFCSEARAESAIFAGCGRKGFYFERRMRDFEREPVEAGWWRYEAVNYK